MSFKISCPHCQRVLNATESAFGKTISCPSCNQPMTIPHPPQPVHQASPVGAPPTAPPPLRTPRQLPDIPTGSIRTPPSGRANAELVVFRCPNCSVALQAQRQFAGKVVTCSCGCSVQVPSLTSPPLIDAEPSFKAPPNALGLIGLLGVITAVALVSSFLGTLLLRRG